MKKSLLSALVLLLIATVFVGCSSNQTASDNTKATSKTSTKASETATTKAAAKPVTLKVLSGLWSKPNEQQFVREEVIPAFEKKYNAKVDLQVDKGDNIKKQLQAQKGSNKWTTDIVMTHSGDMPTYIESGYVQPLDDVKNSLTNTHFIDAFNSATMKDGKTYYLPISADVYLLLANKKALPYLPKGADVNKLTWDQYRQWADNIAKAKGAKVAFPLKPVSSTVYQMGGIGLSYGSKFPNINSDAMKNAWNVVADMVKHKAILSDSFNYGDPVQQMKSGEAWLTFFHMVPVGDIYATAPAQYVVAAAPAGPNGNGSIAGAWGVGISAGTTKKDLAEKFIKYLTSPDVLYKVSAGTGGFIPPVKEVISKLGNNPKDVIMKMGLNTLNNGVVSGVPASLFTDWGAVKNVYDNTFKNIWDNHGVVSSGYLDKQQAALDKLRK